MDCCNVVFSSPTVRSTSCYVCVCVCQSVGSKVLVRSFSVYTVWCLVQIWVQSCVVKFWYKHSVFTMGGVGYNFGLSLGWCCREVSIAQF